MKKSELKNKCKSDIISHINHNHEWYPLQVINGSRTQHISKLIGSFTYLGEYHNIITDWIFNQKIEASVNDSKLQFSTEAIRKDSKNEGRNYVGFNLNNDTSNINLFRATDYDGSKYTTFETPTPVLDGDLITKKYVDYTLEHFEPIAYFKTGEAVDKISIDRNGSSTTIVSVSMFEAAAESMISKMENIAKEKAKSNYLMVGSIVISTDKPRYGEWEYLGNLEDGQTIIGHNASTGNCNGHTHTFTQVKYKTHHTFMSMPDPNWFPEVTTESSQTAMTGTDDKNRVWGIGIGEGMIVWRRVS